MNTDNFELVHGIYESIITKSLQEKIERIQSSFDIEQKCLESEERHLSLALHIARIIASTLASIKGEDMKQRQAQLCNELLDVVGKNDNNFHIETEKIVDDLKYLLKVQDRSKRLLDRPSTPLTNACLFTGTNSDLSLDSQLCKEIRTANRIDIICSFIKWSGIRLLLNDLKEFTANPSSRLRIITTSYLGATDLKAIEILEKLPNTELLVSYDTERTRLHAKAYIFHRDSGFGAAYIGSSNISNPALTSGLEWNLKISQFESPYLWDKACATFETYQNAKDFSRYTADSKEKLRKALVTESRGDQNDDNLMVYYDIYPYPYQEEILDKLIAERQIHARYKNLVVAATGTGKTVIAAFDFKTIYRQNPNTKFLFVVHREEILKQSRSTFRNILRNYNFGELLVGNFEPKCYEQLFVSIQSMNSRRLWEFLSEDYYDYIVIDEFHHSASESYQKLLNHFKPKYLLGLTATPERHDGMDILAYFSNHITAEIRLPDAINRKLLAPFQYFGITDTVDLSNIPWRSGRYDLVQLNLSLTGNRERAALVVEKMQEILLSINECRALCFCASQDHASFMSDFFTESGVKSSCLTSDSTREERNSIQQKLVQREINVICVVDIYNEGIDIKELDTVIFLRPTESLTVFLQQLGRGLRLHEDKECLTVLDFVGNANKNFNFEYRFRAMIGANGKNIIEEINNGFSHLPAGCHVKLEKLAQSYILDNIRGNIYNAKVSQLTQRITTFSSETGLPLTLSNFLDYHNLLLENIYHYHSWSRLCQIARVRNDFTISDEERLTKGLRRILHMNSIYQLKTLLELLHLDFSKLEDITTDDRLLLTMLHFSLWGNNNNIKSLEEGFRQLKANEVLFNELLEVISYLYEKTNTVTNKPSLSYSCPLELHANYTRDEILASLGNWTIGSTPDMREGVKFLPEINTDIFLITLNKSEKNYSPTTMYLDYALSDVIFHWQSQSTTSVESITGQRYINHEKNGGTILLFVRENKKIKNNLASSYCFLGPAVYKSHSGSKPINIEWRLKYKMPAHLCRITERMATA